TDPRFAVNSARVENVTELDAIIGGWMAQRDRDAALAELQRAEVAAAPVYDVAEIFADPHFQARGSMVSVQDTSVGPMRLVDVAARFSETPGQVRHTGPALGSSNAEVYGALGVSEEEQEALRREGVI
ncbi:MAG TPA: CoA transferase, partial [Ktedonobacterales bacterium]